MKCDISCVINAHNENAYLHRAVKSALQNVSAAEKYDIACEILIILDNASQDTLEVAENYVNSYKDKIRTVHCEYKDLALSRNRAVLESTGEYVGFLDGDDLWGESWISSAYIKSKQSDKIRIIHPQYNVYFSKNDCHVMEHISQDDPHFFVEFFHEQNYWTSLSFAPKYIYLDFPYKKNELNKYFGYEDWTWNYETVHGGVSHTIAKNTVHFIRRGKKEPSLLDVTNKNCLPRVYPLYNRNVRNSLKSIDNKDMAEDYSE